MYADDHTDKIAGVGRQLRSMANSELLDVEDLARTFGAVQHQLDVALDLAVCNLRTSGRSWTEIGNGLGITRQAAQKRWSRVDGTVELVHA